MRGGEHARRRGEGSIEGGGIEGAQRGSDILSPRIASGLEPLTPAAGCAPSLHPHRPCTLQTPKWPPPPQGCLQVLINGEWTKNLSIKVAVLGEAAAAGGGGRLHCHPTLGTTAGSPPAVRTASTPGRAHSVATAAAKMYPTRHKFR